MPRARLLFPLILSLLCLSQAAGAATVRVEQLWYNYSPIGGVINPSYTAETVGVFDNSGLSGVGVEQFALTYFGLAAYTNGVGQHFLLADFPDPPSTTVEGNIMATFHDGVFQNLGGVDNGGAARIAMTDGNSSSGAQVEGLNIAGVDLIRHFSGSGSWYYRLQTTNLVYPQPPSAIPLPGAIWLFAPALAALGWLRRRNTVVTPQPV